MASISKRSYLMKNSDTNYSFKCIRVPCKKILAFMVFIMNARIEWGYIKFLF